MNIKSKLTSRKFWLTLISIAAGVAELFGADGSIVSVAAGAAMALVPAVVYVITEGRIDAAAVGVIADAAADALEVLGGADDNSSENDQATDK